MSIYDLDVLTQSELRSMEEGSEACGLEPETDMS